MKTGKSRSQLPLPYLIPADFRIPELLLNQAMLRVAILLNRGICKEFYWVCRTINVEGKVDVSFDATQLAIRKHEEAGCVRLEKRTKIESKFCEQAESYYNEENDFYYVVPNDSLFKWWEEQESGDTNAANIWSEAKPPADWRKDLKLSATTMRNHINQSKLVVDKISTKLWRIRLDTLQKYSGK